jgi:hypothetical protein
MATASANEKFSSTVMIFPFNRTVSALSFCVEQFKPNARIKHRAVIVCVYLIFLPFKIVEDGMKLSFKFMILVMVMAERACLQR